MKYMSTITGGAGFLIGAAIGGPFLSGLGYLIGSAAGNSMP